MADKSRYTLLLTERSDRLLDELEKDFGKRSRAEVFDLAVTLLDWVRRELKQGHPVGSYNEQKESFRQLLLPGLVVEPVTEGLDNPRPHKKPSPPVHA